MISNAGGKCYFCILKVKRFSWRVSILWLLERETEIAWKTAVKYGDWRYGNRYLWGSSVAQMAIFLHFFFFFTNLFERQSDRVRGRTKHIVRDFVFPVLLSIRPQWQGVGLEEARGLELSSRLPYGWEAQGLPSVFPGALAGSWVRRAAASQTGTHVGFLCCRWQHNASLYLKFKIDFAC